MRAQLVALLDAARAERSASIVVACRGSAVQIDFPHHIVVAEAGRDATKALPSPVTADDEIVLQILGWQRNDDRDTFVRAWHEDTTSDALADDIVRTFAHAYRCDDDEAEVRVELATRVRAAATA